MAAHVTFDRDAAEKAIKRAAAKGLRAAATHVKKKSQDIVPTDIGEDLKRSADTSVDEAALKATVSYGAHGVSRAYAVRQHEDLALHHDEGKKAKFLEEPLHREAKKVAQLIADPIRQALK